MENQSTKTEPITGFDEIFEDGIIVDGTGASLEDIDRLMQSIIKQD